jgi:putative sugar O-methyltransferase
MIDAQSWKIEDDLGLLELMLGDVASQPALYQPGSFWIKQSRNAVNEIRRCGLSNFRGRGNGIGQSYADKQDTDVRESMNFGARRLLKLAVENIYPFNRVLEAQVRLTLRNADEATRDKARWLESSPRILELQSKYRIPYSLGGGCELWCEPGGERIANHYLALLDGLDHVSRRIDLRGIRSFFEIGGGFGINLHLLLANFSNVRKCIYLDIPPNLYVGTQYLKSHFPGAVKDYRATRGLDAIRFAEDDSLEILCVAPWQIEKLASPVDLFHNAHSFVEMPEAVVANYARHAERLLESSGGGVALASYGNHDERTIPPDRLPGFFKGDFERFQRPVATSPGVDYVYYVRAGSGSGTSSSSGSGT